LINLYNLFLNTAAGWFHTWSA